MAAKKAGEDLPHILVAERAHWHSGKNKAGKQISHGQRDHPVSIFGDNIAFKIGGPNIVGPLAKCLRRKAAACAQSPAPRLHELRLAKPSVDRSRGRNPLKRILLFEQPAQLRGAPTAAPAPHC